MPAKAKVGHTKASARPVIQKLCDTSKRWLSAGKKQLKSATEPACDVPKNTRAANVVKVQVNVEPPYENLDFASTDSNVTVIEVGGFPEKRDQGKLESVIDAFDKILVQHIAETAAPQPKPKPPKLQKSRTCSIIESKCVLKKNVAIALEKASSKSLENLCTPLLTVKPQGPRDLKRDFVAKSELDAKDEARGQEPGVKTGGKVKEFVSRINSLTSPEDNTASPSKMPKTPESARRRNVEGKTKNADTTVTPPCKDLEENTLKNSVDFEAKRKGDLGARETYDRNILQEPRLRKNFEASPPESKPRKTFEVFEISFEDGNAKRAPPVPQKPNRNRISSTKSMSKSSQNLLQPQPESRTASISSTKSISRSNQNLVQHQPQPRSHISKAVSTYDVSKPSFSSRIPVKSPLSKSFPSTPAGLNALDRRSGSVQNVMGSVQNVGKLKPVQKPTNRFASTQNLRSIEPDTGTADRKQQLSGKTFRVQKIARTTSTQNLVATNKKIPNAKAVSKDVPDCAKKTAPKLQDSNKKATARMALEPASKLVFANKSNLGKLRNSNHAKPAVVNPKKSWPLDSIVSAESLSNSSLQLKDCAGLIAEDVLTNLSQTGQILDEPVKPKDIDRTTYSELNDPNAKTKVAGYSSDDGSEDSGNISNEHMADSGSLSSSSRNYSSIESLTSIGRSEFKSKCAGFENSKGKKLDGCVQGSENQVCSSYPLSLC